MRKNIIIIIGLLSFYNCTPTKNSSFISIPIAYDLKNILPFSDSDYEYTVKIIPLSPTIDAYIKFGLNRLEVYKDFFYILSTSGTLTIFLKDGQFIKKIIKGRGPGELIYPIDITIDRVNDKVEIMDIDGIKIFDLIGNFERVITGRYNFVEFIRFGNKRIFYDSNRDQNSVTNFTIIEDNGKIIQFDKKYGPTLSPMYNPKHFYLFNDEVYMCSNYSNAIYKMGYKDSIPVQIASVESMNTNHNIKRMNYNHYKEICHKKKLFYYLTNFIVNDSGLLEFSLASKFVNTFFFDRLKNQIYFHPFNGLPVLYKPLFSNGTSEYFLFSPEFFNDKTSSLFFEKSPSLYNELIKYKQNETELINMYIICVEYKKK